MKAVVYKVNPAGWALCRLLQRAWPSCLCTRLNGLSLRELPAPPLPGADWVRCRTLLGGICGTDLNIIAQRQPPNSILQAFSSMPMVLGHENVAVVEHLGPQVPAEWLGKRVCVDPSLGCRQRGVSPLCPQCRKGNYGACESFWGPAGGKCDIPAGTSIGYNSATGGSLGQQFVAHVSQLVEVPGPISDEEALLTDPIACSLHSVLRARLDDAAKVLVYGAGVLGLGVVACLRATGYTGCIDVIARGPNAALAKTFGADEVLSLPPDRRARFEAIAARTGARMHRVRFGNLMLSGGYNAVFDCVGTASSINESLKWAASRGQVVIIGTGAGGRMDLTPVWFGELEVIGAYGRQDEHYDGRRISTYALVHKLMLDKRIDARRLLTHAFRLDQWKTAVAAALNKRISGALKVAIDFRQN